MVRSQVGVAWRHPTSRQRRAAAFGRLALFRLR